MSPVPRRTIQYLKCYFKCRALKRQIRIEREEISLIVMASDIEDEIRSQTILNHLKRIRELELEVKRAVESKLALI